MLRRSARRPLPPQHCRDGRNTKLELLIACIDTSLSEIPVRDRADYQAMGEGTPLQRAATAARWLRDAYERSASI